MDLPLAFGFLPLLNGVIGVYKGLVVGDPEFCQQLEGNSYIALIGSQVGVGQHHIINRPQQGNLVTRYLRVMLEDGADDFI